jgi:hypothetical protein
MIETLPKGALKDTLDERDFPLSFAALPPVDWSKGSGLSHPPLHDQNQADACVGHAWSYYHYQLKGKEFSRVDLFARIAQSYGANIRDGGLAIVKAGQQTEAECPDPNPETPQNMRDKTKVNPTQEADDIELNSFILPGDIDSVAAGIAAYKGVVFGVEGTNAGWHNLEVPEPPTPQEQQTTGVEWGHALYAVDFHIHQNIDGSKEKCIIVVTSWPNAGITEHHIRQRYFDAQCTFNPWTLIPKSQQPMNQTKVVLGKDGTTVYLCTPCSKMDVLQERSSVEGFPIPNPIPPASSL